MLRDCFKLKRTGKIGKRSSVSKTSILCKRGTIIIGDDCLISDFCYLDAAKWTIRIGNNVSLNAGCAVYGCVEIGNYVRIASHSVIIGSDHKYDRTDIPIALQGSTSAGVIIKDDVWIGAGSKILDGTIIGQGCIIGAGSVVKGNLEPYGIYAGAIARKIKSRLKDG